jgi:hypothetical protein
MDKRTSFILVLAIILLTISLLNLVSLNGSQNQMFSNEKNGIKTSDILEGKYSNFSSQSTQDVNKDKKTSLTTDSEDSAVVPSLNTNTAININETINEVNNNETALNEIIIDRSPLSIINQNTTTPIPANDISEVESLNTTIAEKENTQIESFEEIAVNVNNSPNEAFNQTSFE